MRPHFVLVHSPSVGPATWRPVAEALAERGYIGHVPDLTRTCTGEPPFWPRIVDAVLAALADVPKQQPIVLVAHSNAGLFVPVIRRAIRRPVAAIALVDAALPAQGGETPVASDDQLDVLRSLADADGVLPRWTAWWDDADVAAMFPDPITRKAVSDEQPRLPLSYYKQRIPAPRGWDDGPVLYVEFSSPYATIAAEAHRRGYAVQRLPGEHLHQIVAPAAVAALLLAATTSGSSGDRPPTGAAG